MGSFLSLAIDPDYIDRENRVQEFERSLNNNIERSINIENDENTWITLENTTTVNEPTTLYELFFGFRTYEITPVSSEQ